MPDRPVLLSAPMVRATLIEIEFPGTGKTQTRRVMPARPLISIHRGRPVAPDRDGVYRTPETRYKVGDRLWVRESYFQRGHWEPVLGAVTRSGKRQKWRFVPADETILFDPPASFRKGRHAADPDVVTWHRRLGRFMPRFASRMTLIVTATRVERLQDISQTDAIDEGVLSLPPVHAFGPPTERGRPPIGGSPVERYARLWDTINGPGAWDRNPWVAAYTFRPYLTNIDAMEAAA